MSQENQILEYLLMGNELSPLEALNKFGCLRLGARIWDLKKKGYDFINQRIKHDLTNDKHYAVYFIPKDKQLSLKF